MLFNPIWNRPKILTVEDLVEWLESKNPAEEYVFISLQNCLIAQYLRARGYKNVSVGGSFFFHKPTGFFSSVKRPRKNIPPIFNNISTPAPRTFGAALERARAYLGR